MNPAVLNDPEAINEIEILEEEQDGEREERAGLSSADPGGP